MAERSRFENVERFVFVGDLLAGGPFAGDQFHQIAVSAIKALHQQTDSARVASPRVRRVLYKKLAKGLDIARSQQFEAFVKGIFHRSFPIWHAHSACLLGMPACYQTT